MNWDMEIMPDSSWLAAGAETCKSPTKWTQAENKAFENALALYDKDTPDRWEKVAEMVPGKTVADVISQYRELEEDVSCIEAGLMDLPPLAPTSTSPPFTLDYWGGGSGFNAPGRSFPVGGKRPPSIRTPEQERKKGVPWTEEEHRLFLMGLKKYGKGDWRNISRNFVISRTPTQVASHAQKYFIRQLSGGKDKRRASIHDITTVNLSDEQIRSPENKKPSLPAAAAASPDPQQTNSGVQKMPFQWNNNGAVMGSYSTGQGNFFGTSPYGVGSFGIMNRVQQGSAALQEIYFGPQSRVL